MPLRFPSPSSPTFATSSRGAAREFRSGNSDSRRASAIRADSPAPLSDVPGPVSLPSGAKKTSSGRAGARTVSKCADRTIDGSGRTSPNVATTLPARSSRALQPKDSSCSRNHSARACSKKVGAGMRQSSSCCLSIQGRSCVNHRWAWASGAWADLWAIERGVKNWDPTCGSVFGSVANP